MVPNSPTMRPRRAGGAISVTLASATIQRIEPAMPPSRISSVQSTGQGVSAISTKASAGIKPLSMNAHRSPRRLTQPATNGVPSARPSHSAAATTPTCASDRPMPLSVNSSSGKNRNRLTSPRKVEANTAARPRRRRAGDRVAGAEAFMGDGGGSAARAEPCAQHSGVSPQVS